MLFRPERGSFKKFQKYRNFQGVHGFCRTMELLSPVFFVFGKSIQKRVLWDISNKEECFLDKEKEVLQKSKNSIFSMVFVKKLNFLSSVFFGRIKPEKIVFWDFGYKRMLFRPENWSFKKVQKIEIWKNAIFPTFLTFFNFLTKPWTKPMKKSQFFYLS